ncbi:siderophore-interacting protein [Pseudomonas sp. No.21]|uniref:siderophore-interacting protein n=1 Tax=Pseudomonas TaxID=286 RepID=UPI000DA982E4|nr:MULTISPECIES: siderophore-interacting protein [Pseudomonas]MDW3712405.1 siderophore-interacting protein [Pseudomonas sp. 2023EL-01195]PZE14248.1 siderophore-interacting protein [Pseudomonas sp. 57B-090624]GJN45908.1 siderophore-interacting protein [Pseudomonas tohonis]
MDQPVQTRRVQRVRHELRRRELDVLRVERISPHFMSVTFGGDALADFVSASFDDHIKFMFVDGQGELVRRDYTPRRFDPERRELTLEFALHGEGGACEWAERAQVGDSALIGGPRGSMIIPMDYDWHLLVGDSSALPAIHRRLEELPAGARVTAIVQLAEADRRDLRSAASLDLRWVDTPEELVAAVQALPLPAGEGYAWGAGEHGMMTRVRALLVEKGQPKEAMRVAAYWRQGFSDHHEDLEG